MPSNILITGAAGYIGGSLVAGFMTGKSRVIGKSQVFAAVRSEGQSKALSEQGINVLQLDLQDRQAVTQAILRNNISIVVQTASSLDPGLSLPLIAALGEQKRISGDSTYYVHTSGMGAFTPMTGWPLEEMKDTGAIFETEKKFADSFPLRMTDVTLIEEAQARGVISFTVVPPLVYGKGTGQWNKLSVVLPLFIKACISDKRVHKFGEDRKLSGVHINDLVGLYGRILDAILQKETLPSGTEGYYFAIAHKLQWWEIADRLSAALSARNLVEGPETHLWTSERAAADSIGIPEQFVGFLFNSSDDFVMRRSYDIGWRPSWDEKRFFANIDDEIEAVSEFGKAKSSLVDSLWQAASG